MNKEIFNKTFEKRFWDKVNIIPFHNCWEWNASTVGTMGYGQISYSSNGDMIKAHRASYLLHYEEIPDNLFVLHKCDNPKCVRPEHLFLGTCDQNHKDKNFKFRQAHGEKSGLTKLKKDQVYLIRKLDKAKVKHQDIAFYYSISESTVYNIVKYRTWKYLRGAV